MTAKTLITALSTIMVVNVIGVSALFAQTQAPNPPQGSMGPGMMQGDRMMPGNNPSSMGGRDMNKMMADCDKMMKDKGMKMSGDMKQMMDQCNKMMNTQGTPSGGTKR